MKQGEIKKWHFNISALLGCGRHGRRGEPAASAAAEAEPAWRLFRPSSQNGDELVLDYAGFADGKQFRAVTGGKADA